MLNKFYRRQKQSVPREADPLSLQEHIHTVQQMRNAAPARRHTGKVVIGAAVVGAIIALWQFGPRFGWGPGGRQGGNGQGSINQPVMDNSAHPQAVAHQRPLRIVVDGNHYLVNDKDTDLATIRQLAGQVSAGDGPAVEIERKGSSRAVPEQKLKKMLDEDHVTASWMPPLE
jgi:hypothetical protein